MTNEYQYIRTQKYTEEISPEKYYQHNIALNNIAVNNIAGVIHMLFINMGVDGFDNFEGFEGTY